MGRLAVAIPGLFLTEKSERPIYYVPAAESPGRGCAGGAKLLEVGGVPALLRAGAASEAGRRHGITGEFLPNDWSFSAHLDPIGTQSGTTRR